MEYKKAVNTLALRLCDWAVHDFLRELEEDCPLLSLIAQHNRRIGGLVLWNRTLRTKQRAHLAKAMVLLFHENARHRRGEKIDETIKKWGQEFYDQTSIYMDYLPPLVTADTRVSSYRSSKSDLVLEMLASCLPSVLGGAQHHRGGISCSRWIGDWRIATEFVYAPREMNLSFDYQFIRKDGWPILEAGHGPFPRNLLAFYGIYPRTVVGVPSEADVAPMARAMSKLAEHFLIQSPSLFAGLGLSD